MTAKPLRSVFVSILGLVFSTQAYAFEDSKVMPKGIRRLTLRVVNTDINQKTDATGSANELERPLAKDLTFKDILKGEKDPVKRQVTAGYLTYENFNTSDSVGSFTADLKGRLTVFAPIMTYGLTEKVTLAAAMPVFNMAMSVGMGFKTNSTGQAFLKSLNNPYNNQTASARDAGDKINNAVARLNTKLVDNGYKPVDNWQANGLGDLQLLSKARVYDGTFVKSALTGGVVLPTGRTDDPDILIDKGFGDGQWDVFFGAAIDEPIADTGLTLNQYAKYTHQLPGQRTVRMVTAEESIEVPKERVRFKLGDKIEAGTAVQMESDLGVGGGVGYNYYRKFGDLYKAGASSSLLAKDSLEQSHQAELELVYSGVPAFRRKEIPVPFETKVSYKRQLASKNMAVTHFVQFDAGVFF